MVNINFYFQFVHYSNEELSELKKFIKSNIPGSITHLISNKDMLDIYGISNSIGRIIYIRKTNFRISDSNEIFSLLDLVTKNYNQLNLFLIQVNDLFLNVSLAKKYLTNYLGLELYNNLNNIVLFNSLYLLNWLYINMFHKKLSIISNNIIINSISLNNVYSNDYI